MDIFDKSFDKLTADQDQYWTKGREESAKVEVLGDEYKFKFGFMQGNPDFFIVKINDLVLRSPVLFIGVRHGPKGPGPGNVNNVNAEAAIHILADAIVANPEYRDALAGCIKELGVSSSAGG